MEEMVAPFLPFLVNNTYLHTRNDCRIDISEGKMKEKAIRSR